MVAAEAFWRAPRRLRRLLERRELTPTQFAVLTYLGLATADREDFVTSYETLAALLDVSKRTIERSLPRLRELDFVEYQVTRGHALFSIRVGPAALVVAASPSLTADLTPGLTPEGYLVSDPGSDTTSSAEARNPAPREPSRSDTTSDTRTRAETETETEVAAAESREEFEDLLAPLERLDGHPLNGRGRELVALAFAENPDGVSALARQYAARKSARSVKSATGTLVAGVKRGEHGEAAELGARDPQRARRARPGVCPECEIGGGRHVSDCSRAERVT